MTIAELGSLGELVSGLAVLVTLIYLAVQVRHSRTLLERNEKIALSQVYQARTDTRLQLQLALFNDSYAEKVQQVLVDLVVILDLVKVGLRNRILTVQLVNVLDHRSNLLDLAELLVERGASHSALVFLCAFLSPVFSPKKVFLIASAFV